jgi:hypothetical protein
VNSPIGAFRKGMQSKSINNKDSFLIPNQKHLDKMVANSSSKELALARFYKVCKRVFKQFLGIIPSRLISQMPLLNNFTYKVLNYSFEKDSWETTSINPFKK